VPGDAYQPGARSTLTGAVRLIKERPGKRLVGKKCASVFICIAAGMGRAGLPPH